MKHIRAVGHATEGMPETVGQESVLGEQLVLWDYFKSLKTPTPEISTKPCP